MEGKLNKADWFVSDADPHDAAAMITEQHYAAGVSPVYAYVHGLYHVGDTSLYGVAWWKSPMKQTAVSVGKHCNADWRRVLDLSRVVVDPFVPSNGASFLIGHSERIIRQDGRFDAIVSFADTFRGHSGSIYKAANWEFVGTTKPEPIWVDPETGRQVSKKQDVRSYRVSEMEEMGYIRVGNSVKNKFVKCLRKNPSNESLPSPQDIIRNYEYIDEYLDRTGFDHVPVQVVGLVITALGLDDDQEGKLFIEQVVKAYLEEESDVPLRYLEY